LSESGHLSQIEPLTEREEAILHLLEEGLTNREIADRLFLSPETVKWYNKQIFRKLGVTNRTQAAAKAQELDLQGDQQRTSAKRTAHIKHNLPAPVTSFIGRQREVKEISDLLGPSRLLTLTGPAGTGKTRLALRVAAQLLGDYSDGVYLVELAPLKDSAMVVNSIARSLGIKEFERHEAIEILHSYFRNRTLLLLIDNFEHVIEAAPMIADLLADGPGINVLATSREALGVYGEQIYPVAPLTLPNLERAESLETLKSYDAVSLFLQRAQSAKPDFELTDENTAAVAEICTRLDGLPLAIELAAARIWMVSPQMLLEQLESRFAALQGTVQGQPARHATLLAAITWSYELLDEGEKLLFARLSVFRGGSSIEASKEICSHDLPMDNLDGLESLLRKNMLRQIENRGGELRFDMLETIHEYAADQLERSGETSELRSRHAEYFAALVEQLRSASRGGSDQLRALDQLETEHDNILDALDWSLGDGDPVIGLRLVGGLGHFWFRKGHYAEAQRWTSAALDRSKEIAAEPDIQAAFLNSAGVVAHFSDDRDEGRRLHLEALDIYKSLDDDLETGWLLIYLGAQAFGQHDEIAEATAHVEEGLELLQRVNDRAGIAQALHILGELVRHDGHHARALEVLEEGLSIARDTNDALREILILDSLTYIAVYDDDVKRAASLSHAAFLRTIEVDHRPHIPAAIAAAAAVSMAEGDAHRAARLLGASHSVFEAHGFTPRPSDMPDVSRSKLVVRKGQDPASFESAWAEGLEMSEEDAIAYALSGSSETETAGN
jgi:predicted ATPase/DNA-binding CsgD family transcriptional regulator